jgi:hypothetical protein
MTNSTIIQLCVRCAGPLSEHDHGPAPQGLDAVDWDAWINGGCGSVERMDRLEAAVDAGVSPCGLVLAQDARFARDLQKGHA